MESGALLHDWKNGQGTLEERPDPSGMPALDGLPAASTLSRRESTSKDRGTSRGASLTNILIELGITAVGYWALYLATKSLLNMMDPTRNAKPSLQKAKEELAQKLKHVNVAQLELTDHERMLVEEVLYPAHIEGGFDMVGGLEETKREIYELVVLPLKRPDIFNLPGRLLAAPKGILFYGAPGTGKTMLAKAIAKESGAAFINVRMSTLMSKWFGESNKMVAAIFSLARKLAPCVIFIDEIDSFLRHRGGSEYESAWVSVKAEFMTLWDGILTDSTVPIMVLGATNRPYDLDQAILRRLPRQFEIGLPEQSERRQILQLVLKNENVSETLSLDELARRTHGYSGSDLKELCRAAVMLPVRELMPYSTSLSTMKVDGITMDQSRPVTMEDFEAVFDRVRPTGVAASDYYQRTERRGDINVSLSAQQQAFLQAFIHMFTGGQQPSPTG